MLIKVRLKKWNPNFRFLFYFTVPRTSSRLGQSNKKSSTSNHGLMLSWYFKILVSWSIQNNTSRLCEHQLQHLCTCCLVWYSNSTHLWRKIACFIKFIDSLPTYIHIFIIILKFQSQSPYLARSIITNSQPICGVHWLTPYILPITFFKCFT